MAKRLQRPKKFTAEELQVLREIYAGKECDSDCDLCPIRYLSWSHTLKDDRYCTDALSKQEATEILAVYDPSLILKDHL